MANKICPICGTLAHEHAIECGVCGAELGNVVPVRHNDEQEENKPGFDFQFGETDLAENQLKWPGGTYIFAGALVLAALICMGSIFVGATRFMAMFSQNSAPAGTEATPISTADTFAPATNTTLPTLVFSTVTDAPPTHTPVATPAPTETPGPCMQQVQTGDSLIGLVSRCGHRDLAVIDLVLELNNLDSPEALQAGQTLEIPWPTPTVTVDETDAEETASDDANDQASSEVMVEVSSASGAPDPFSRPTATLQPGVAWHTVTQGENIISVAVQYGADAKILSELNPEVTFSQCDFGQFGGGPSCVVLLYQGQRIRVPAPTLTPTLSPTPSGSETPTPTPTPTYNAPSVLSPGHRALFQRQELVTLRWVASGSLGAGQTYRVNVRNLTDDVNHKGDTTELFFVLPESWQGESGRHEYEWTVSVTDVDNSDSLQFTTEPRNFFWEGRDG